MNDLTLTSLPVEATSNLKRTDELTPQGFLCGDEDAVMVDAHVAAGMIVGEPFAEGGCYDFANSNMVWTSQTLRLLL